jgi:hypothetical protein
MIQVRLPGADGLMQMIAAVQSEKTKDRFPQVVEKWKAQAGKLESPESQPIAAISAFSKAPLRIASRVQP